MSEGIINGMNLREVGIEPWRVEYEPIQRALMELVSGGSSPDNVKLCIAEDGVDEGKIIVFDPTRKCGFILSYEQLADSKGLVVAGRYCTFGECIHYGVDRKVKG